MSKSIPHKITTAATMAGGRAAQVSGDGWHAVVSIDRLSPETCKMHYSGPAGIIGRIDWYAIADRLRKEMQA